MNKNFRYKIEYYLFVMIEKMVHLTPGFLLGPVASGLAVLVFSVIRYRREVALENLTYAFPDMSSAERKKIAFGSYRHFALLILEFMKMSSWDVDDLEKMVRIEKTPAIDAIVEASQGQGTILVSGHLGNWEIAIALLASKYFDGVSVIQARQRNFILDKYIADMRRRWGIEIIYSRGAVKHALTSISRKRLLGLLPDQDGGKRGVFVPFLGRMASTQVGAATLHLRSRSSMIFGGCVRIGQFKYRGFLIPVNIDSSLKLNRENVQSVTAKFTAELEQLIRQYPEQYLWMHRRWKTPFLGP